MSRDLNEIKIYESVKCSEVCWSSRRNTQTQIVRFVFWKHAHNDYVFQIEVKTINSFEFNYVYFETDPKELQCSICHTISIQMCLKTVVHIVILTKLSKHQFNQTPCSPRFHISMHTSILIKNWQIYLYLLQQVFEMAILDENVKFFSKFCNIVSTTPRRTANVTPEERFQMTCRVWLYRMNIHVAFKIRKRMY